ncbi:hypothetical protein ACFWMX_14470 [Streptomyces sp. NPDC058378]|uniref:hypothetical protein n=1 Tax=Streptomyces sp. NPDC058378 TaxID=3346469 RepID=UPI003652ABE0
MTRCVAAGRSHDFPFEDSVQAHCPEHGVRIVWKRPFGEEPAELLPPLEDPVTEPAAT